MFSKNRSLINYTFFAASYSCSFSSLSMNLTTFFVGRARMSFVTTKEHFLRTKKKKWKGKKIMWTSLVSTDLNCFLSCLVVVNLTSFKSSWSTFLTICFSFIRVRCRFYHLHTQSNKSNDTRRESLWLRNFYSHVFWLFASMTNTSMRLDDGSKPSCKLLFASFLSSSILKNRLYTEMPTTLNFGFAFFHNSQMLRQVSFCH